MRNFEETCQIRYCSDRPLSPRITVVIVTYQRPRELKRLLHSVRSQVNDPERIEVCVVNNGGANFEQVHSLADIWIDPDRNLGASGGRNLGVKATSGGLLFFLDDDAVLQAHALDYIERVFEDQTLSAIRGRVIPLEHPAFNCIARLYNQGDQVVPDLLTLEGVTVIRRAIYESVGGYCEDQFAGEGLELSERILQSYPSAKIEYHPQLVIAHDYVSSWRELWLKARRNLRGHEDYRATVNPQAAENLIAVKQRYSAYEIPDGRSRSQRIISYFITRIYRIFRGIHSYRDGKGL